MPANQKPVKTPRQLKVEGLEAVEQRLFSTLHLTGFERSAVRRALAEAAAAGWDARDDKAAEDSL